MSFFDLNRKAVCSALAIGLSLGHINGCAVRTTDASLGTEDNATTIAGEYIVVLKAGRTLQALNQAAESPGERGASAFVNAYARVKASGAVLYEYHHALQGFTLRDPHPNALSIWRSHTDWVAAATPNTRFSLEDEPPSPAQPQENAPWNLARIDQQDWDPYNQDKVYDHMPNGGEGVRAYVIDSGIYGAHQEFCKDAITPGCNSRIEAGYASVGDPADDEDYHGHGTHVAGTIGGLTYGVAKAITLVPVRIVDKEGHGSAATIIEGVDYVTGDAAGRPAVANMSLKIKPVSEILNLAVRNSIASGIVYAVSAGNDTDNACWQSPAAVPEALTVGATDLADQTASFSNLGPCVDIVAPGHGILSALHGYPDAFTMRSGTSMATPHIAGIAALWLQRLITMGQPSSVFDVMSQVTCHSTPDRITGLDSLQPNLLAFTAPVTTPEGSYAMPAAPAFQLTTNTSIPVAVGSNLSLSLLFQQLPCFVKAVDVYQNDNLLASHYLPTERTVTVQPVLSGPTSFRVVLTDGLNRQAEAELEVAVQPRILLPIIR